MFKRILIVAVLGIAGACTGAEKADAGIYFRRVAPVRRVAARAVLPPYPVARRVIVPGPLVYTPYVTPVYSPMIYGAPYMYGGGVSVVVGY